MRPRERADLLLAAGMLLWVAVLLARWPLALSFGDEVGYVGQVRLLLDGRVHPLPESPGVWLATAHGRVTKFPLLLPLLVTPLFAVTPRLVFASGVLAALALCFVASRVLKAWGRSPLWGLVFLAHPTVVILARTVMADLLLAAFAVGAWWALRRGRGVLGGSLIALVVGTKAIGFFVAMGLVAGEALRAWGAIARREPGAREQLVRAVAGLVSGMVFTSALNVVTTGEPGFVYDQAHQYLGTPQFWPRYFPTSAPAYATALALLPPLLVAGAWPFWRRREFGPLAVIAGLTALMCFYFFVDRGRTRLETLVLAPRLILPVVAFLLVGYADLLAGLAERAPRAAPALAALLVVAPALVCLAVSSRHRAWQEGEAAAVAEAARAVQAARAPELGLTGNASKAALLYPGRVSMYVAGVHEPDVVLCNAGSESYRDPASIVTCALPGYEERAARDAFHVFVRRPR